MPWELILTIALKIIGFIFEKTNASEEEKLTYLQFVVLREKRLNESTQMNKNEKDAFEKLDNMNKSEK